MKRFAIIAIIVAVLGAASYLPLKKKIGGGGATAASEALTVHFTGDVSGRLEPCGCFTGQYGGLTRLATMLDETTGAESLRVDIGDAIAGTEDYHLHQYRYLTQAFDSMGFVALNLGAREASLSANQLRDIQADSPVPLVNANVFDIQSGKPVAPSFQVVEHAGRRVVITGVVDPDSVSENLGDGLRIEAMETAIGNALPSIAAEQPDYTILLAFTTEAKMRGLAKRFYEFDLILGGDVPQPSQELIRENDSYILYTTNQARAVGGFVQPPDGAPVGPGFKITLLDDMIPQSRELIALSKSYREFLRETPLDIDAPDGGRSEDPSLVPGSASPFTYVGSAACMGCHQEDHAGWANSAHAHAFEALVEKGADADPNCIKCHTVGFGEASGYRREFAGQRLAGVGCENCHGPGSQHIAQRALGDPAKVSFKFRSLGEADCTRCHYGEFSRPFDWKEFWPPIQHGGK